MGAGDVEGEEIDGEDDGDDVEEVEEFGLFLLVGCGGRRRDLAEEKNSGEADKKGDDGEHEEEDGGVVGKESSAEVSEDGGAQTHVTLQYSGDRTSIRPEVSDACHQNRRVHPCRTVASHA